MGACVRDRISLSWRRLRPSGNTLTPFVDNIMRDTLVPSLHFVLSRVYSILSAFHHLILFCVAYTAPCDWTRWCEMLYR